MIVDDGVATGASCTAACQVARAQGASRVVAAIPIGAIDTVESLSEYADEVVCLRTPALFFTVGEGYRDFSQIFDHEVVALLDRAREPPAAVSPGPDGRSPHSVPAGLGRGVDRSWWSAVSWSPIWRS